LDPGPALRFLEIFSLKRLEEKGRFRLKIGTPLYAEKMIVTLAFKRIAIFLDNSGENFRKW
jgi:hypothetical protein